MCYLAFPTEKGLHLKLIALPFETQIDAAHERKTYDHTFAVAHGACFNFPPRNIEAGYASQSRYII